MKNRNALFVSLGLGFFAVLVVHLYVSKKESDLHAGSELKPIYVAADDIPENVRIEVGMVKKIEVPSRYIQPEATTELEQVIGSVARVPIFKDTQLTRNLLLSRLESGLAMRVDPMRRAMAVGVSDVTGVAGLIQPGNRVDVYASFKIRKGDYETVQSLLLLTNIKVLAVERRIGAVSPEEVMTEEEYEQKERAGDTKKNKDEYPKNITLSVTPQEALRIITAQEAGSLTITLRAQFDEALPDESISSVSTQDIIGKEEKTAPQRMPRYEQIRGNEVSY